MVVSAQSVADNVYSSGSKGVKVGNVLVILAYRLYSGDMKSLCDGVPGENDAFSGGDLVSDVPSLIVRRSSCLRISSFGLLTSWAYG